MSPPHTLGSSLSARLVPMHAVARRGLARPGWVYAGTLIAVLLLCRADMHSARHVLFDLDDPYITLHNARVLLTGHEPNFGATSPLAGTTSAVHLALVTLLLRLAGPQWALHIVNWLAILLYALGLIQLAFQHRATSFQAALLVAAGLLVAQTPAILLNGMETGLAMAGVVWALVAATTPRPNRWLPVLCGWLPFLRPELALFSILLLGYQGWRRWRMSRSLSGWLCAAGLDLGISAAVAAPWLLWYGISTGVPYPGTMEAKRDFFAQGMAPAVIKEALVSTALQGFLLFVGTVGWGTALLASTAVGRIGMLFGAVYLAGFYALFPGGLLHNEQRYLYLLLPFALYGVASWLASPREGPRYTAHCLLLAAVAQSAFAFPHRWDGFMTRRREVTAELQPLAGWCRDHLPPGSRLLIHDAGYLSCATRFPLTDMVGLKTPSSMLEHRRLTWPSAGRLRPEAVDEIARQNQDQYLIVTQEWDEGLRITAGLRGRGWKLTPLDPPCKSYQVYRLAPPGVAPGNR